MFLCAPLALPASIGAASELVQWSARLEPRDARAGEGARVVVTAQLASGWHLYSTTQPAGGSSRTRIALLPSRSLQARGTVAQPAPQRKSNPAFKITDELYQGAVSFGVPVMLGPKTRGPQRGVAEVRFQLCSDRLCSPLKTVRVPFSWTPRPGQTRAGRRNALTTVPAQRRFRRSSIGLSP
jgi:thiol:disulfide interchange protein DsbD